VPARVCAAALEVAALGYPVFPLKPNTKAPATRHGKDDASTDPEVLRRMFKALRNLGIAWPPGVLAIDLDVPKDKGNPVAGACEYADEHAAAYEARYPELRTAPRVRTRADGVQWVVRLPDGVTLPSTTGAVALTGGGGLDLRGDGRTYTAAPPSTVAPGRYTWDRDLVAVAALPVASPELLEHLTAHAHGRNGKAHAGDTTADGAGAHKTVGDPAVYARSTLTGTRQRLGATTKNRNDAGYAAALNLGRWVGGYQRAGLPGLTRADAYAALLAGMQENGDHADDPSKAEGTIERGLDEGIASAYVVTVKARASRLDPQDGQEGASQNSQHPNTTPRMQTAPRPVQPATEHRAGPHDALARFENNDPGNAERVAHTYGHMLRYAPGIGWLVWTGTHWDRDAGDRLLRFATLTMRATAATAELIENDDERARLRKHARASLSTSGLRAAVDLLLAVAPRLKITTAELNADPWVLNVENGLLDLRTGTLHPHDPAALCTKVAPVSYDPDATHPALDALLDVLDQDGRAEYLRAIAGQALTGEQAKRFYVWTGPSGTAKSTTADMLAAVLGPYAVAVDASSLLVNKHGPNAGGARADLVAMFGARLAIAAELPNGGRLDSAIVKRLTGGDPITARAPYATETLTFRPAHTLVMHANNDPKMDWSDDGMRHRMVPVPFTVRPETPDPGVRATLLNDPTARAAVLAWATAGAVQWHANGQQDPEQPQLVKSRKTEYLLEQDPFSVWAEETLEKATDPQAWTPTADITNSYRQWCEANGERPDTSLKRWIADNMRTLGGTPQKQRGARGWVGVQIRKKGNL
jgi:P4 family phage/plasmid primase-like protien